MPLPQGFDTENPTCPKCGGGCWDNRENKRNPKQPDYKCKDQDCNHAIWITPPGKGGFKPKPATLAEKYPKAAAALAATPVTPRKRITVEQWLEINDRMLTTTMASMAQALKGLGVNPKTVEQVLTETRSMVASFWICVKDGIVDLTHVEDTKSEPKVEPKTEDGEVLLGAAAMGYQTCITDCVTVDDVDNITNMFMADKSVPIAERAYLVKAKIERIKEIELVG